jgi:hypothetical protein
MAGVAVGWAGRSVAGSTREGLVRLIVLGHEVRHDLRRTAVERWEWIEDLMAEGRIRYDEKVGRGANPGDGGSPEPWTVVETSAPSNDGRAA